MRVALPKPGSAPTLGMALLLATLSMVSPMSIDTFFPSFPAIAEYYHLTSWQVQQIITAYLIPYSCFTLVHGPLSDALGRRPVVIGGLLVYTVASIGCVFAPTFGMLLIARALQGMAAGIGPTVARAVVRDLYDGPNAQRLMSAMMMIFSIAPALAPVIGGWIHVTLGWRSVFGFMLILGVLLTAFASIALPETHPPEKRSPLNLGDLVRSSLSIMRSGRFMLLAFSSALCLGAILTFIGAAPAIVMKTWGLGETQFHHLFIAIIGGFMLSSFVSNRIAGRVSRVRQLRIGLGLMICASAVALALEAGVDAPPRLAEQGLLFVLAFGAQTTFPILALEMLDLFPHIRGAAASVQSFIALGFCSLEIGFVSPSVDGSLLLLHALALAGSILGLLLWRAAARLPRTA
jgi:DHA1 family bicyclomycin/chloramphenicol resistance-like MFS transporter